MTVSWIGHQVRVLWSMSFLRFTVYGIRFKVYGSRFKVFMVGEG